MCAYMAGSKQAMDSLLHQVTSEREDGSGDNSSCDHEDKSAEI